MPVFADPIVIAAPAPAPALAPLAGAAGVTRWSPGTPPGTWAPSSLPVVFTLASETTRDVGGAVVPELDVALRTWSLPPCTAFRARHGGPAPTSALPARDDGVNVVVVHEDAWPAELTPGAIAQTVVHLDPSGAIHDADVHLNAVDYRFSLDGATGTFDLRSVLVHEIGHALGLGHTNDARATMATNGSGTRWRSLEADDRAGVCALYPGPSAQPSRTCEVEPCPVGYACVGGRCQRPGERSDLCAPCDPASATGCEAAGDDARCVDPTLLGLPLGGSVCGRGCASDDDCGEGFTCRATTAAGDRQCVATDGCRTAASPCTTDAECAGARCAGGACVGPVAAPPDARAVDGGRSPSSPEPVPLEPVGGACAVRTSSSGSRLAGCATAGLAALAALFRRSARAR